MKCVYNVRLLRRPRHKQLNLAPPQPQPHIDPAVRGLTETGRGSRWRAGVAAGAFQFL